MNALSNVNISGGRIVAAKSTSKASGQKGIKTHNRFTKIFADIFGSGTITVQVSGKKRYASLNDSYNLVKTAGIETDGRKAFFKQDKDKIIGDIQEAFNPLESQDLPTQEVLSLPAVEEAKVPLEPCK